MGAVYEGVRKETRERFAIKVLDPALAALPAARARFLKEAKLTGRVRHPHIVDVTDVVEDGGLCYFAMELLEGEDLARRLQRSGALSAAETVDIMLPVCDAVAEAHRCGITHRDLKPSNIFLSNREGRLHPVVLDFGIAMDGTGGGVGDAGAVVPGRLPVFGTPYYLAPEQVADHQTAGPASDQYALGDHPLRVPDGPASLPRGPHRGGVPGHRRGEPAPAEHPAAPGPPGAGRGRVARAQPGSEGSLHLGGGAPAGAATVRVEVRWDHARAPPADAVIAGDRGRGLDAQPVRADADPRGARR